MSLIVEAFQFFQKISPLEFFFSLEWSPQTAIRSDQVGSSGSFGILPLLTGTVLISLIALLVAGPLGLFSAIYLAEILFWIQVLVDLGGDASYDQNNDTVSIVQAITAQFFELSDIGRGVCFFLGCSTGF